MYRKQQKLTAVTQEHPCRHAQYIAHVVATCFCDIADPGMTRQTGGEVVRGLLHSKRLQLSSA